MQFTRITANPNQMDGVPCIRNLRIPVASVVGMVADHMTIEDILSVFPDLEREDIQQALHYAAEALREKTLPVHTTS
ncbi:DUF433 domain-containing protein [Candidatus Entotheonella palauensis]|uniref:Antitoxin n=1 Tax=Candidatus Entotheonella gemina TaxID=1429439 RepID=W4LH87_9BACT|nr:DUF433 domain-containing protein [Candidatus Entotheonella palauensis]ETW97327.1 MAG: hypothetical protein ETSY2_44810 [Candidatus Entotheonella gemina]